MVFYFNCTCLGDRLIWAKLARGKVSFGSGKLLWGFPLFLFFRFFLLEADRRTESFFAQLLFHSPISVDTCKANHFASMVFPVRSIFPFRSTINERWSLAASSTQTRLIVSFVWRILLRFRGELNILSIYSSELAMEFKREILFHNEVNENW